MACKLWIFISSLDVDQQISLFFESFSIRSWLWRWTCPPNRPSPNNSDRFSRSHFSASFDFVSLSPWISNQKISFQVRPTKLGLIRFATLRLWLVENLQCFFRCLWIPHLHGVYHHFYVGFLVLMLRIRQVSSKLLFKAFTFFFLTVQIVNFSSSSWSLSWYRSIRVELKCRLEFKSEIRLGQVKNPG